MTQFVNEIKIHTSLEMFSILSKIESKVYD